MPEELLRLSGIGKNFGAHRVLDDVAFDLHAGEVHVLAGENGAGKSTLIKILGGVHAEFDGTILLAGSPVRFATPLDAGDHGIAVIHQEQSLIDGMSVADNILLGREPARAAGWWLDRPARALRVRELCARIDLGLADDELTRPVEQFSLSVRNQIEIAKALAGDARIFVMDEPTSALNRAEVEKLFVLIETLKRGGSGIIYISHKMEEIYRVADRITVLRDGRRIGTAPAAECPEPLLIRWMVGRELLAELLSSAAPAKTVTAPPRFEVRQFTVPNPAGDRPDAVRDFSIVVRPGEIVGVAGLQGCGGTELFHGLFGAYGPVCRGTVRIDGVAFHPRAPSTSIGAGLAYLTADRTASGLVLTMSVAGNVSLASLLKISAGGFIRRDRERMRAQENVKALHIRLGSVEQEAGTLSGGNQQKVVLAKWLATQPKVLLLDDPTRGVDVAAKHEIHALLRRLAKEGMAMLLISTEMPELLALCDRVVVLHRGATRAILSRAEATAEKILGAAMDTMALVRN
jgi:ABC-type sugar transport system ATPase subunit